MRLGKWSSMSKLGKRRRDRCQRCADGESVGLVMDVMWDKGKGGAPRNREKDAGERKSQVQLVLFGALM